MTLIAVRPSVSHDAETVIDRTRLLLQFNGSTQSEYIRGTSYYVVDTGAVRINQSPNDEEIFLSQMGVRAKPSNESVTILGISLP